MIESFGYSVSTEVVIFALLINLLLLMLAMVGFTNLMKQIRELKAMLTQIREKQRKLKE